MRLFTMAFIIAAFALTIVSPAGSAFADKPDASFDVACTVGGDTVVSWRNVHLDSIHIEWYDSTGAQLAIGNVPSPHGHEFSALTPPTMDVGGRVEVTLAFKGEAGAKLEPRTCF